MFFQCMFCKQQSISKIVVPRVEVVYHLANSHLSDQSTAVSGLAGRVCERLRHRVGLALSEEVLEERQDMPISI